jgi:metallophosphoesterase (TIGR00282 family)
LEDTLLPSNHLRILFIGDVVAESGMKVVEEHLPKLIEQYRSDCVIVNAENAWEGKGPAESHAKRLYAVGAQVLTTGNHVWENWQSRPLLHKDERVLRPHNYPAENAGKGHYLLTLEDGRKVGIAQFQGRTYMQPIECPLRTAKAVVAELREQTNCIFIDFHAEATAEKVAFGNYLDGKVSCVAGTHTHIPTSDARIFQKGTAYITDVGMTGSYDSVIGMRTDIALKRLFLQTAHKYESANGDNKIAGIHVVVDYQTGKALHIEHFLLPPLVTSLLDSDEINYNR